MRFHLYLDCDNAAFDQRLGDEVARILTVVAATVDAGKLDPASRDTVRLRDMNGNTVGRYWVETTAADTERRQRNTADAYATVEKTVRS